MEQKQVAFRRINGRIVPIKINTPEDRKRRNFGIGAVAVGGAIAAASTRASYFMRSQAGLLNSRAEKLKIKAKWAQKRTVLFGGNDPDLFKYASRNKAAEKLIKGSNTLAKRSTLLRRAAPHVKNIGIWTAASVMGSGLARIFESKNEDDLTGTFKELGFTAATAAAIYGGGDKAVRAKVGYALAKILSRGKIK